MKTKFAEPSIGKWLRFGILTALILVALGLTSQPVQSLMAGHGLMWSVWVTAPVKLVVCWENPSAADPLGGEADQTSGALRREWVRMAVKRNWERYARVIFVGWGECQNESTAATPPWTLGPRRPGTEDENLKVNISYSGASNNWGHGSWGDYQKSGVTLNLHCTYPSLKSCIEYLAIHEFGHTLGFYHEEERADWPANIPNCPKQTYAPSDPWWPIPTELPYGAPDPSSVMAYCSNYPTSLSPKDISGIQKTYMRRQPGTLLSVPGSLCLSGHANNLNGDVTFGWECNEANNDQEWIFDREKASLSIVWPPDPSQKQRCLDVDTNTYSKVQIWDCHYGANQQWSFRRVEIHGYGGLCLTRPNGGTGPVDMQTCAGSPEQLWRLEPGVLTDSFKVRSETGDYCLVASDIAGTAVAVDSCIPKLKVFLPLITNGVGRISTQFINSANPNASILKEQTRDFYLVPGGQLGVPTSGPNTLCVDVADVWDDDFRAGQGGPAVGQKVQVFQCYINQLNQRWNLSGDIVSGEKCLAVTGNRTFNGAGTAVSSCNNGIEQNWDYYW